MFVGPLSFLVGDALAGVVSRLRMMRPTPTIRD